MATCGKNCISCLLIAVIALVIVPGGVGAQMRPVFTPVAIPQAVVPVVPNRLDLNQLSNFRPLNIHIDPNVRFSIADYNYTNPATNEINHVPIVVKTAASWDEIIEEQGINAQVVPPPPADEATDGDIEDTDASPGQVATSLNTSAGVDPMVMPSVMGHMNSVKEEEATTVSESVFLTLFTPAFAFAGLAIILVLLVTTIWVAYQVLWKNEGGKIGLLKGCISSLVLVVIALLGALYSTADAKDRAQEKLMKQFINEILPQK